MDDRESEARSPMGTDVDPLKYKYGVPHHCPKCSDKDYFGLLKVPNEKLKSCPNCRSRLVQVSPPANHLIDTAEKKQRH